MDFTDEYYKKHATKEWYDANFLILKRKYIRYKIMSILLFIVLIILLFNL